MKYIRFTSIILFLVFYTGFSSAQDVRTAETKVADLLAQLPSGDITYTNKLMSDMLSLGEQGLKLICDQIIPLGSGDDIRQRFAVESLSRYLSQYGKENEKAGWEKICIGYVLNQKDNSVKDFFMKQLQTVGGTASVEAMKVYLSDKNLCEPALAVIDAAGRNLAEKVLSEALKDKSLPCAAHAMNILASMKSEIAVYEFISWAEDSNISVRASAYNALAQSGNPVAYPVLQKAAQKNSYSWERSGATASLLNYAKAIGDRGDNKTMEKICKNIIAKCNDRNNIQYKTFALETLVNFTGYEAMPYLLETTAHPDKSYRNAALRFSLSLTGSPVTRKWIEYFPDALPVAKPEIVRMLGSRKDEVAATFIKGLLSDNDINVRMEATSALMKISGEEAIPALIDYMIKFTGPEDQENAKSVLMTVLDNKRIPLLIPVLRKGPVPSRKSAIELIAWSSDQEYYSEVFPFTSSDDDQVRLAAFKALTYISGPSNLEQLIRLLDETDIGVYKAELQAAITVAANQVSDPEKRSVEILNYLTDNPLKRESLNMINLKIKIIPVLANTGGTSALSTVLREFENGGPELREVCFKALTSWKDFTASTALYEICASRNKTYEGPAFDGYLRQIRTAPVTDDQKLLLIRKIMPFALSADRKNQLINETGKVRTYQALFFTAGYLDDPLTGASAAKAIMNITLPAPGSAAGMCGSNVREILGRAMVQLKGPESDYDKEGIARYLQSMPHDQGFIPMFNGKDLSGWQGLVENPLARAKMKPAELAKKQVEANKKMLENWSVRDGCIWFNGSGDNLCSIKEYSDFELLVDWKITKKGDSGIYLRGSPQVQIWDTSRTDVGAQVGSGGLYNNQKNESKPLTVADNPVGDWNSLRIIMTGEKVTVWLNGMLVVDNITMENYWERSIPICPKGAIELQAHGTDLAFRDIYVREIL